MRCDLAAESASPKVRGHDDFSPVPSRVNPAVEDPPHTNDGAGLQTGDGACCLPPPAARTDASIAEPVWSSPVDIDERPDIHPMTVVVRFVYRLSQKPNRYRIELDRVAEVPSIIAGIPTTGSPTGTASRRQPGTQIVR